MCGFASFAYFSGKSLAIRNKKVYFAMFQEQTSLFSKPMRPVYTTIISTLLLCACTGRPILQPIAQEGKMWHVKTQIPYYDDRYTHDVRMWIDGDTMVDGLACKRLYKHSRARYGNDEGTLVVGYCRQEGDRYYQDGELMFDLGLQVGDTFMPRRGMPLVVRAVGDTTLTDGLRRKCLLVADATCPHANTFRRDYWVEGIGSLQMGILSNDFIRIGVMRRLLHCTHKEDTIYSCKER